MKLKLDMCQRRNIAPETQVLPRRMPPGRKLKALRERELKKKLKNKQEMTFLPNLSQIVGAVARKGGSDEELADVFGVPLDTWMKWRKAYPAFADAIEEGRTMADANVVHAMYKRAIGYAQPTEKIHVTKWGSVLRVDTKEHIPPDVGAGKFWLTNRQPQNWKERTSQEHSGRVEIVERKALIDDIVRLMLTPSNSLVSNQNVIEHKPQPPADDAVRTADAPKVEDKEVS